MPRTPVTKTLLDKTKSEAKRLKKQYADITHTQALDLISKQHGYRDYQHLISSLQSSPNLNETPIGSRLRFNEKITEDLIDIFLEHFVVANDRMAEMCGMEMEERNALYRRVWIKGLLPDEVVTDREAYNLNYGLGTEEFKHVAYELQKEDFEAQLRSAAMLAIAHFWRSVGASIYDTLRETKHPGFERYMQDWLLSMKRLFKHFKEGETIYALLQERYPSPDWHMMQVGSTYWGSKNGRTYEGRKVS